MKETKSIPVPPKEVKPAVSITEAKNVSTEEALKLKGTGLSFWSSSLSSLAGRTAEELVLPDVVPVSKFATKDCEITV